MPRRHMLTKAGAGLLAGYASMLVLGGACQPQSRVIVNTHGQRELRAVQDVARGQLTATLHDPDYALVRDMALLSAVVYAGKKPPNNRPGYHLDRGRFAGERAQLAALGWQPLPFSYSLTPPDGQAMARGLTYDVWVREAPGKPPLAVLVFRGTNFNELADWQANFRPLTNTGWVWDQYEQVRALTPELVKRLDAAYGGRQRIFAAGHSLGGGLAQHAGLTCGRVEKVFAFNSSPLTGYFDVAASERQPFGRGRRAFLIYESNEVLSVLRFVPSYLRNFINQADVVILRYNFSYGLEASRPFLQHGIKHMVQGLNEQP